MNAAKESCSDSRVCKSLPGGRLEVDVRRAELPPDSLFDFAARENPRRPFLFLSRVLGKHLPVTADTLDDLYARLASRIPDLPEPVVFVGMAETATALGQGVFEDWLSAGPGRSALYLQTTRYRVRETSSIGFEETHSHAPRLFLHVPSDDTLRKVFLEARSFVYVDDEVTTGKTCANLIDACRQLCPRIESLHICTITDLRDPASREALEARSDVHTSVGALLQGECLFIPHGVALESKGLAQSVVSHEIPLATGGFGRIGRKARYNPPPRFVSSLARTMRPDDRILVLGTGEFMHPAFRLARELRREYGHDVRMHATTRSPIQVWGPIREAMRFEDNYGEGVPNYLYNCRPGNYDQILICHETAPTPVLKRLARTLGARLLYFRSEHDIEENPVR